jgi:hypothetical protein
MPILSFFKGKTSDRGKQGEHFMIMEAKTKETYQWYKEHQTILTNSRSSETGMEPILL